MKALLAIVRRAEAAAKAAAIETLFLPRETAEERQARSYLQARLNHAYEQILEAAAYLQCAADLAAPAARKRAARQAGGEGR